MDGRKGGDGAVGERVRKRAHADHDEELQAVVFEGQGERGEALIILDEPGDHCAQEGAREEEGSGAARDGGGRCNEPAVMY